MKLTVDYKPQKKISINLKIAKTITYEAHKGKKTAKKCTDLSDL